MFLLWSALAFSAPSGRVDAVVVFPDRAEITRVIDVPVVQGSNKIVFADLPPTLDERSLQVEGDGVPGARILGLDVVRRELVEDRRARVSDLQAQITAADDELRALRDAATAAKVELGFLDDVKVAAAAQVGNELLFSPQAPQRAKELAELLRTRVPELLGAVRASDVGLRDAQARRDALARELSTVQGADQYARRDVTVEVESPTAGKVSVKLAYVLPGASWTPVYDARADVPGKKVGLALSALIVQTTGEDWTDVALSLSTARPQAGTAPPEVVPFWLARPEPVYEVYSRAGRAAGESMDDGDMEEFKSKEAAPEAPPPPPAPMAVVQAVVEERAVATTFAVPVRAAVPGDGTRRKIRVTEVPLDVEIVHVTAPRFDPSAFLVARGAWKAPWPLLPGEVAAFVGDAFVGTQPSPVPDSDGLISLGFGRDDRVRVNTVTDLDQTSAPSFFGRVTARKRVRLTVDNGRSEAIVAEVVDRLPRSSEERWKVVYRGEPASRDDQGVMRFVRPIAPGASATVAFGYDVSWPRRDPPGVVP